MIFEVEKDLLLRAISTADSIISVKSVNHLLSLCLMNIRENKIEIVSTDKDIMLKTCINVNAKLHNEFSFLVNAKKLFSIIKEFPKGEVQINVDENYNINVKSKSLKGNYSLIGMAKGEFPEFPKIEEIVSFEFDQADLKDMIRKVSYAVATDNIKPVFCGVFFSVEDKGKLSAVATDARRLSLCSLPVDPTLQLKEGVIIPSKTIGEVNKLLTDNGKCVFSISSNMCCFEIGNTEIISRMIDGQFPNYKQVIPRDFSELIIIKRQHFIDTLRRIMVFTKEPFYKVLIKIEGEIMFISTESHDFGKAEEEVEIFSTNNSKFEFFLSANYLYDSFREMDCDEVEVKIQMNSSPIVITPKGKKDELSVVMPINIKND